MCEYSFVIENHEEHDLEIKINKFENIVDKKESTTDNTSINKSRRKLDHKEEKLRRVEDKTAR